MRFGTRGTYTSKSTGKTYKLALWAIHVDHPWSEDVREHGAPLRAYVTTPWWFLIIALWPGHQAQVYDWKTKTYTDRWSWAVRHPLTS